MEKAAAILLFVVVFAIVGGVIWLSAHLAKKRRAAVAAVAERLGLTFEREANGFYAEHAYFKMLGRGRSQKSFNQIGGEMGGLRVQIPTFRYVTGSGKNQSTRTMTIVCLKDPNLSAPQAFLRREVRFLDALGKVFGGKDINFDEDPEFSKSFVLQGQIEEETRAFFDEKVRRAFLAHKARTFTFEVNGDTLMMSAEKVVKPEEIETLLGEARAILEVMTEPQDALLNW